MAMNKREKALNICMIAGYHHDDKTFIRSYVENRISYPKALAAYNDGVKKREAGMKCNCYRCTEESRGD